MRKKNVMADGYLKAEEITKVVEVTEVVDDLFVVRVNEVMNDTKKVEDTRVVPRQHCRLNITTNIETAVLSSDALIAF